MTLVQPEPGEVIVSGAELWWRQCPAGPAFYNEEKAQPTNLMFRWNPSDQGQLSGARESKSTAEAAYRHAVEVEKRSSKGTWGLPASVADKVGTQLIDDSANLPEPPASPPGHTYLDVREVPTGDTRPEKDARERIRARLLLAASRHHPAADVS
jgi:hypothetical protein